MGFVKRDVRGQWLSDTRPLTPPTHLLCPTRPRAALLPACWANMQQARVRTSKYHGVSFFKGRFTAQFTWGGKQVRGDVEEVCFRWAKRLSIDFFVACM